MLQIGVGITGLGFVSGYIVGANPVGSAVFFGLAYAVHVFAQMQLEKQTPESPSEAQKWEITTACVSGIISFKIVQIFLKYTLGEVKAVIPLVASSILIVKLIDQ